MSDSPPAIAQPHPINPTLPASDDTRPKQKKVRTESQESDVKGQTVSQVCLAQGSTVYVRVDEALRTIFDQYGNLTMGSDAIAWRQGVTDLIDTFATEPLQCANDLYYHLGLSEPNPFCNGCNGAPASSAEFTINE